MNEKRSSFHKNEFKDGENDEEIKKTKNGNNSIKQCHHNVELIYV